MHEEPPGASGAQPPPQTPTDPSLPGFPPLSAYPPPLPADPVLYRGDPASAALPTLPSSPWYPPPPPPPPLPPYPPPPGYAVPQGVYPAYPAYPAPPGVAPMPMPLPVYGFPYAYTPPDTYGGLAIAALVFGIISLLSVWLAFCSVPFAIIGIVMGALGRQSPLKRTMATWGLALSIASLVLTFAYVVLQFVWLFSLPPASPYM